MAKRRKLHEVRLDEDIRYRGPLSYQVFQAFGWLCISLSVMVIMLNIGAKIDPASAASMTTWRMVLSYVSSLSLPFLLIANFSKILDNAEGYRKQLIRNGGAAAAIILVAYIFFSRYVAGSIGRFVTDPEEVVPVLTENFRKLEQNGFIAFNLFIDLFLCTLFMFFLNARPRRILTGKKMYILRALAVLPVAYEVTSMVLKGQAAAGKITLPLWSFPLLTVKPPMTFVVFMVLAIYIKTRELRFCRHGRTHEEYLEFLRTNRNSWHFARFLCIILIAAAVLDIVILSVMTAVAADAAGALNEIDSKYTEFMTVGVAMGFGESVPLLFVAPIVLLYSYTRRPKSKMISMLIPVVGIVLMMLMVIEGIYQAIGILGAGQTEPVSIRQVIQMIEASMAGA